MKLPGAMEKVTGALAPAFTKPTHARVCVLLTAAILTVGSLTVSNILRTAGCLVPGHWSTYHRILSLAKLWKWRVGRILATLVVEAFCPAGLIYLAGDDTVDEHRGAKVYGKGWVFLYAHLLQGAQAEATSKLDETMARKKN